MTESFNRKLGRLAQNVSGTGSITTNASTASAWQTARTITLGGDLSGSVSLDGSSNVSLTATVSGDSIVLGTDTTGNYVATVTAGSGITVSGSGTETASVTVSIDNTVATLTGSQTLTNKTISGADNTLSNIGNASLTNSSITINGTSTSLGGTRTLVTDDIAEDASPTNLWYTDARTRAAISVTDAGGDGSLSYVSGTGVITYTGPSATEVRAHFSAGTGVTITTGQIAIGQAVATTDNVTFAGVTADNVRVGVTAAGEIDTSAGNLTLDSTGGTTVMDDDVNVTGNLQIDGNLTVSGTTVTINATNLAVEDNMIYLNSGSTVTHPDLGFAGNYNDGTYRHAGLFRDESDGRWKFFHQYTPEPDASAYIDITHASFALAPVQASSFIGNVTGNVTGNASTATAWQTARTLSLTGDVTGTSAAFDGSGNISITTTIAADSIALGTDTTGNYVASITNGNYLTGGNGGSEGAALTLAVDATSANTASKVVARDASGNFSAGTITANLSGNASTVTNGVYTTDTGTVTNTMLAGSIANNKLANSTISGISLGGNLAALTIGTGLSGTSYNGSSAVTIAIDSTVTTLTGSQTLTNKTLTAPIISTMGGDEGGEIVFGLAATNTTLSSNVITDIYRNRFRIFESGGTTRGVYIDLTTAAAGADSSIWHSGNDGAGSGLDADLLDGQQGAYYAAASSLSSYLPLSGGSLTGNLQFGANLLQFDQSGTRSWSVRATGGNLDVASGDGNGAFRYNGSTIWTSGNDGASSGLDADLLDGLHASSFMRAAGTENAGTIIIRDNRSTTNYYNTVALEIRSSDQKAVIGLHRDGYSHCGISHEASNALRFNFNSGDVYLNYNVGTVWGSGNDGAGSGLDADLLDGYNSATAATANTIVLRDGGADITGRYFFGVHFNQSSSNSENPTIAAFWTNSSADNYNRKSTPAHVISQLGLLTSSNYTSYVNYGNPSTRGVYQISNWNQTTYPNTHFLSSENNTTNAPTTDFTYGLQYSFHRDGASYRTQMVTALYSNLSIYVRNSRDGDAWTSWKELLHSGNYNSYTPTLTGTGASGTWGISISGNAATATSATSAGTLSNNASITGLNFSGTFALVGSGASTGNSTGTRFSENYGVLWNMADSATWHHQVINGSMLCGFQASGTNWGSGKVVASSDMRATIFYDYNDTGYYIDPNSTGTSLNMAGSVRQVNYNKPGLMTVASGTASTGGSIAIQQETAEGWTGIFCDFEPYTGWGFWHDNPNNYFSFTAEASTGQIRSFTVPSRVSGNRTAYEKFRIDQGTGDTITGRIAYANESSRSPIFYDNNDTGYYIDPNSSSNSALRMRGGALFGPNTSWSAYLYVGTNGRPDSNASVCATNGNLHIDCANGYAMYLNYYSTNNIYTWGNMGVGSDSASYRLHVHGTGYATSDFRAPIFYDSNDTGYYVDPTSFTELYGGIRNTGNHYTSQIINRLPAANNGAGTGIVQLQMWCSEPGITWDSAGFGYNVTNDGGSPSGFGRINTSFGQAYMRFNSNGSLIFYNTNTSGTRYNNLELYADNTVYVNNYATAGNSFRAPIFYDSNDTNWYCNPNSTSRFYRLNLEDRLYIYGGNPGDPGSDVTPQVFFKTGGGLGLSSIETDFWTGFTGSSYPNNFQIGFRMAYDKRLYVWQDVVQNYSDERLKQKTGTLVGALDAIKSWTPFKYVDNALANSFNYGSDRTQIGLSAQEVQQYYPELVELAPFDVENDFSDETNPRRVSKSGENYLTLNYTRLVPVLVQAIKEQQQEIELLKKHIRDSQ